MSLSSLCIVRAAAVERLAHHRATASRSPVTAASAARWETLATFEVGCDWRLVAALIDVGRADHPADPPAGHRVGLGHAVDARRTVGQLGHERRHRRELVLAVGEVLVDLVGDDPDAVLDGPAADRLDLVAAGRRRRSGWTATRTRATLVRGGAGRLELVDGDPEAGRPRRSAARRPRRRRGGSARGRSSSTARAAAPRRPGRAGRRTRCRRRACRRW